MADNGAQRSEQRRIWYKSRIGFVVFTVLIALIIMSVFAGASLYSQQNQANDNLVCFVCQSSRSNQSFTITADVNLTDNMDQNEAIKIAAKLFAKIIEPLLARGYKLEYLNTHVSLEDEIWTVKLDYAYTTPPRYVGDSNHATHAPVTMTFHKTLNVIIDPQAQIVKYDYE